MPAGPPVAWPRLRPDFVDAVEWVLQREPPHLAEACIETEVPEPGVGQAQRPQPRAATGERGGQAVEEADPVEERAERAGVLLQLIRAVDLDAEVAAVGLERLADRARHGRWVRRVVDHVEGGDEVV